MRKILVSACLYGECTRYDGKSSALKNPIFSKWKKRGILVPVCPEVLGGLKTPRPRSEISDGRVLNELGEDVTESFEEGARRTLETAEKHDVVFAVLKQSSPSCGCRQIYDGTFSGSKIPGSGVTAELLLNNGIVVFDENELALADMFYENASRCRGEKHD